MLLITGTASLDARLPGQWFNLETGLHYNWHRSYDPTLGRYTQADPLGFPDGPARYAYAVNSPQVYVDPEGRAVPAAAAAAAAAVCARAPAACRAAAQAVSKVAQRAWGACKNFLKDQKGSVKFGSNRRFKKQFQDAVKAAERDLGRKLSAGERRRLHDEITGRDYGYHDIVQTAKDMFRGK